MSSDNLLKGNWYLALAEHQRHSTRPGLAVRGTLSPARAWRPAVVARLARTLGVIEYTHRDLQGDNKHVR